MVGVDHHRPAWTGQDVLKGADAVAVCGDPATGFSGVSIDSRTVGPDELFVAIRGEVHDGHLYVPEAIRHGCRAVLIERDRIDGLSAGRWAEQGVFCTAVADTRRALGDLAAYHRSRLPARVVAITGSNGKTSTRQMTVAVASALGPTLAPASNFNNDIGVPLTLFRLTEDHRVAVLELGMNHFGEIARLTDICRPDIGVITNVGPAHLEGVGSLRGVQAAKGELLDRMPANRRAVLNADDPRVLALAQKTTLAVLLFGTGPEAGVRAEKIRAEAGRLHFFLALPSGGVPVVLDTPARFMIHNALAAAAVGHLLGLSSEDIRAGLESFSPVKGRLQIIETRQGVTIIDDTYNANPGSMAGVLQALTEAPASRRILVVGDMKELGAESEALHRRLGADAMETGLDRLFAAGDFAGAVADGAAAAGMAPEAVFAGSKSDILKVLADLVRPGDWIAVKGSRAMKMEEVVEGLLSLLGEKDQQQEQEDSSQETAVRNLNP